MVGSPARVIRSLDEKEIAWKFKGTQQYMDLTLRCLNSLQEVEPLTENSATRLTHTHFNTDHVIKSKAV